MPLAESNPLNAPDTHKLIQRFEWNARHVIEDPTALYFRLSRELIGDGKLLVLASHVPAHQPAPNLFFSAVHYLLMRDVNPAHPLREFFPDLAAQLNTRDDPYPVFREFCLAHAAEIRKLLETRRVQVNEIARCACFLPAFHLVSQDVGGKPFALIEVGSSAGLNLQWDQYAYDYRDVILYGARGSDIVLQCELRGAKRPPLTMQLPRVAFRFGIDLHPNNVLDADAMLWLRALVWPEHVERAQRLEKAIQLARQRPPLLIRGDALEVAARALDSIASDVPVLLFHSFVLNQFSRHAREQYHTMLVEKSAGRQLYDLAMEPKEWPTPLVLTRYENGTASEETLAFCDHLGRWMEWLR
ncbi:MAG: DUF2332 domain-containing protein [Chloroflexota bacterium]|nr:MAG: DUF2332 domain-containing protein [Chloroflexota bacterium]